MISLSEIIKSCRKYHCPINVIDNFLQECHFTLNKGYFVFTPNNDILISDIVYLFRERLIDNIPHTLMLGFHSYDWRYKKVIESVIPQGYFMTVDYESIKIYVSYTEWKKHSNVDVDKEIKHKLSQRGLSLVMGKDIIC